MQNKKFKGALFINDTDKRKDILKRRISNSSILKRWCGASLNWYIIHIFWAFSNLKGLRPLSLFIKQYHNHRTEFSWPVFAASNPERIFRFGIALGLWINFHRMHLFTPLSFIFIFHKNAWFRLFYRSMKSKVGFIAFFLDGLEKYVEASFFTVTILMCCSRKLGRGFGSSTRIVTPRLIASRFEKKKIVYNNQDT